MNAIYVVFDVESGEVLSLHETYIDAYKEMERLTKQSRGEWWEKTPLKVYYTEELRVGNKWCSSHERGTCSSKKELSQEVPF